MAIEKVTIRFSNLRVKGELILSVPYVDIKVSGNPVSRFDLDYERITMTNYRGKAVCGDFFAVITDSEYILFGTDGNLSGSIDRSIAGDIVMADEKMLVCLNGNVLRGYDESGKVTAQNTVTDAAAERIRSGV